MNITIILPLTTGLPQARACVESIAALPDDPAHNIVIVNNAGADLEPLLAQLEGDVLVAHSAVRAPTCQAINAGLGAVTDGIVAVVTGMACVHEDWLSPLTAALADPSIVAAASAVGKRTEMVPAAARAIAWRREDLDRVPEVPDGATVAAICAELAGRGRVVTVQASRTDAESARETTARVSHGYGGSPELSVVIPTLDAASDRIRRCVSAIQSNTDVAHEIIVVDNGAPPQGFTAPVNSGIRAARGRFIAVCNDDVEVLPGWWQPLAEALNGGESVVFPLTVDGVMREDFAAWCFAMTQKTVQTFGVAEGHFFDPLLVVWFQDTDLLIRLRDADAAPKLVEESRVRHGLSETVASADKALRDWIDVQVVRDQKVFEHRYGPIEGAL